MRNHLPSTVFYQGIRVRAVSSGGTFLDPPDVVSALLPTSTPTTTKNQSHCRHATLGEAAPGDELTVTQGNLKSVLMMDGRLSFIRVSDGKTLLTEKMVRHLAPTVTRPPVPGFFSLELAFQSVEDERIYGVGQHAAFPWQPDFPVNGQLDQKGVPPMLMEPHDGASPCFFKERFSAAGSHRHAETNFR